VEKEKGVEEITEGSEADWFTAKWGWYVTLDQVLAKGVRKDFDYFYKMNIFDFLNHLCYLKDKADHQPKKV